MREKWHIRANGEPGVCRAEAGNCPLGRNQPHYDSEEEAKAASSEGMEKEYGLLAPSAEKKRKMSKWERKDLSKLVQKNSKSDTRGFNHECLAGVAVAESMGLERIAIVNQGEPIIFASMESRRIEERQEEDSNIEEILSNTKKSLRNYYEKKEFKITNEDALVRVIYYSGDPSKGIYVQSGSSNVLDAAILKDNKVREILEVKQLTDGAQMSSKALSFSRDGELNQSSLEEQTDYIKNALRSFNMKQAEGSNYVLKFGGKEADKTIPLYELARQYKTKGATGLLYITEGDVVKKIPLRGKKYKEIVEDMKKRKLSASITIRANAAPKKMNEDDFYRFRNDTELFKSGTPLESDTFTLQDIKKEFISKSSANVRVGSFIIKNINYADYKLNMDVPISMGDMKAFGLTLVGQVYHNK